MAGALLQGAVLAGGIHYIHLLEDAARVEISGHVFSARDPLVVTLATLVLIGLLAVGGWMMYAARLTTASLVERYQLHQLRRIAMVTPEAISDVPAPRDAEMAAVLVGNLIVRDAHRSATLVRFLARTIPALVTLLYSVPVIIYLDAMLTSVLVVLLIFSLPLFYRANVMAYESGVIGRTQQRAAARELRESMLAFQDLALHGTEVRLPDDAKLVSDTLKQRLGLLPMYMRALARTDFIVNGLMSLAMGMVLIVQVPDALSGQKNWAAIVAYFVFLRLAVASLGTLFGFLNIFSRFYPSTRRYQGYVRPPPLRDGGAAPVLLRPASGALIEHGAPAELHAGDMLRVWSRLEPTRFSLPYILRYDPYAPAGLLVNPYECRLVTVVGAVPGPGSLRDVCMLTGTDTIAAGLSRPTARAIERLFEDPSDIDRQRTIDEWGRVPVAARIEICLRAASVGPHRVVVVANAALDAVPTGFAAPLIRALRAAGKVVVVVHGGRKLAPRPDLIAAGDALVAVVGARGDLFALGSGRWVGERRAEMHALIAVDWARARSNMVSIEEDDNELQ